MQGLSSVLTSPPLPLPSRTTSHHTALACATTIPGRMAAAPFSSPRSAASTAPAPPPPRATQALAPPHTHTHTYLCRLCQLHLRLEQLLPLLAPRLLYSPPLLGSSLRGPRRLALPLLPRGLPLLHQLLLDRLQCLLLDAFPLVALPLLLRLGDKGRRGRRGRGRQHAWGRTAGLPQTTTLGGGRVWGKVVAIPCDKPGGAAPPPPPPLAPRKCASPTNHVL